MTNFPLESWRINMKTVLLTVHHICINSVTFLLHFNKSVLFPGRLAVPDTYLFIGVVVFRLSCVSCRAVLFCGLHKDSRSLRLQTLIPSRDVDEEGKTKGVSVDFLVRGLNTPLKASTFPTAWTQSHVTQQQQWQHAGDYNVRVPNLMGLVQWEVLES